jgi:hypothetical protein
MAVTAALRSPSPQSGIVVASFSDVATLGDVGPKANAFAVPTILTTAFNSLLADCRSR